MKFTNDDDVKAYVTRQLAGIGDLKDGPFFAHIRPQRRFMHLRAQDMNIGHLEWKIYRKSDIGQLGGDVPGLDGPDEIEGIFGYWALRASSDYQFFFFIHGNSSAGPGMLDKMFEHGSMLHAEDVAETGPTALSCFVGHMLSKYGENCYHLS